MAALQDLRFTVMSFNVWKKAGEPALWPERQPAFEGVLRSFRPDVLCLQESHPTFVETALACLPSHARVEDAFEGWSHEGSILFHAARFAEVEHGAEDLGLEEPLRRLFWVRLQPAGAPAGRTLLVATAHFTWQGHARELADDANLRKGYARRALEALQSVAREGEPLVFTGDLNEGFHPRFHMCLEGPLTDCFAGLGLPARPTHPTRPSAPEEERNPDEALDWIFHNDGLRPEMAQVVQGCTYGTRYHPSDHMPVMALYSFA